VPISALVDCEAWDGHGAISAAQERKVDVRWEQAGVPYHRECTAPDVSRTTFPAWPAA